ncbi:MAG: hypothetical protein DHS20C16_28470 [Phycisphaerae bacterium]|nr:MAG: hypothetical protein DHS20C16_28470 [Phycisphaerae bacterium]
MTQFRLALFVVAALSVGCETPVIVVDGEGGGQVVTVGGNDGQDGGDSNGTGSGDGANGGGQNSGGGSQDTETCTAREDFPQVSPGDNIGDPFANDEVDKIYIERETELFACITCDGRELSDSVCDLTDGETNLAGADSPAFNRTFYLRIEDGVIEFFNDATDEVVVTGGINQDGSFAAVGFKETTTDNIDTSMWKYIEGTIDFQNRTIDMFARTRESASDFLGGGPFDYEYTTQSHYELLVP